MIVPDANLILYAFIKEFPQHQKSKAWLENIVSEGEIIGLSWQVITAFVRIGTNPKLFAKPLTIEQIEKSLGILLQKTNVIIISPTSKHWQIFLKLLNETNAQGDLVMDCHLATLAIEHEAKIASTDNDFKLFTDLEYFNPLNKA